MTDAFRAGDALPGGIQAIQTARASEVLYWLPDHGAVVFGDVLLGAGARPNATADADLLRALRPLLDLPVDFVLVSHGEPVVTGAGRVLAGVLGRSQP